MPGYRYFSCSTSAAGWIIGIPPFRRDIPHNDVLTLILHGDADRILPLDATSRRQAKLIKDAKFVELTGGPHGVLWTHAEQVSTELVRFLA